MTAPVVTMPAIMLTVELIVRIFMLFSQMAMELRMLPRAQPLFMGFGMLFVELIMDIAMFSVELIVFAIVPRIAMIVGISIIAAAGTD